MATSFCFVFDKKPDTKENDSVEIQLNRSCQHRLERRKIFSWNIKFHANEANIIASASSMKISAKQINLLSLTLTMNGRKIGHRKIICCYVLESFKVSSVANEKFFNKSLKREFGKVLFVFSDSFYFCSTFFIPARTWR